MYYKKIIYLLLIIFSIFSFSNLFGDENFNLKIKKFILENPEVILKSIENYQKKIQNTKEKNELNFLKNNKLLIIENPFNQKDQNYEGSIVFINFIDYKCFYCRKANKDINELLESYKDIYYVVKELPILGNESVLASKMALSVLINQGPETYKKLQQKLLKFNGEFTKKNIKNIIKQIDAVYDEEIANKYEEKIELHLKNNFLIANKLGISGTPTYIIENEIIKGYVKKVKLEETIRKYIKIN